MAELSKAAFPLERVTVAANTSPEGPNLTCTSAVVPSPTLGGMTQACSTARRTSWIKPLAASFPCSALETALESPSMIR